MTPTASRLGFGPNLSTPVERVLSRLDRVKRSGGGWLARCPAHDDRHASLSIGEGNDGRALVKCFAGCEPAAIVAALGLDMTDLFVDRPGGPAPTVTLNGQRAGGYQTTRREASGPLGPIVATYLYRDSSGDVVYRVTRHEPKTFRPWHPDGRGGWLPGLDTVTPIPYRWPELVASDAAVPVCVVEGEKDADALAALGLVATTKSGGANGTWTETHTAALAGRDVVILPDNDAAGRTHAERVASAVQSTARSVKVLALAGLPAKGDVSDWLAAGGTADELRRLARVASTWQPATTEGNASRLVLTSLADVAPKPIDWLWPNWLARGKLHLLGAHPGIGKSTLTAWLAAILSRGGILPDGASAPVARTLFLLAEDDLADTVRPRLDLHGADVTKIQAIQAVDVGNGDQKVFSLTRHLDEARAAILDHHIDLWVIDPVSAFMAGSDRNSEDVRDVLTPVLRLAEETGVAVLGIAHIGKPGGNTARTPLQQLIGATAFGAVARLVWMTAEADAETTPPRKVFGVVKSNIGPKPTPLDWSRDIDGPVIWHGPTQYDLDALLTGQRENKLEAAKAFLLKELDGGSHSAAALEQAAKSQGITKGTLRRAKDALKITAHKQPGSDHGPWLWKLPDGTPRQTEADAVQDAQTHVSGNEHLGSIQDAQTAEMRTFPQSSEDAQMPKDEHLPKLEDAQTPIHTNEHLPNAVRTSADDWGEGEL